MTATVAWRGPALSDKRWSTQTWNVVLHVVVVAALSGLVPMFVVFSLLTLLLLAARPAADDPALPRYRIGALFVLTIMLGVFRDPVFRVGFLRIFPGGLSLGIWLNTHFKDSVIGSSYCYLRAVYVVMQERKLTPLELVRYYFFAPTYISGPIMSPDEFTRPVPMEKRGAEAAGRIGVGLIRLAGASLLAEIIPTSNQWHLVWCLQHWSVASLWVGLFFSGVWLYLNFAGFSDIFIGLSAACGVRAPENFERPFLTTNITSFWRCWHISLGNWLRTVVYNPLSAFLLKRGGAKLSVALITPVVTMLVCGMWHQFTSSFAAWGLLHGLGLSAHSAWSQYVAPRLPGRVAGHPATRGLSWLVTHAFVALTWLFFLPTTPQFDLVSRLEGVQVLCGWLRSL